MKHIWQRKYPPNSMYNGDASHEYETFKINLPCGFEIVTDEECPDSGFKGNIRKMYIRTPRKFNGLIVFQLSSTLRPFGNHEHDYADVFIDADNRKLNKLEKRTLEILDSI